MEAADAAQEEGLLASFNSPHHRYLVLAGNESSDAVLTPAEDRPADAVLEAEMQTAEERRDI